MTSPSLELLPHLRRVVTSHDTQGLAVVQSNVEIPSEAMQLVDNARGATIWVTTEVPTNDNNNGEDGSKRVIQDATNFGLVPPTGASLRSTELGPGAITAMHRTSSLDFNILVSGELVLITEDGAETHLTRPGDTVVQKGTLHAWRNPSQDLWARWVTVLVAAEPAIVQGKVLEPTFGA